MQPRHATPRQSRQSGIALLLCILGPAWLLTGCGSTPVVPLQVAESAPIATPPSRPAAAGTTPALPPAGSGRGGYYQDDGPGDKTPDDLHNIPDAELKIEPYSKRGNRPYVVFGKRYIPITHNDPMTQRGVGSWYGKKFHGQKTSSGELYDMYKMTAAHPTLPLPSYARVTNVSNGRQVIVRINDRGPFHASRIIDLSYTAALKLGYLNAGSTVLEVERLLPEDIARIQSERSEKQTQPTSPPAASPSSSQAAVEAMLRTGADPIPASAPATQSTTPSGIYIQLGAYSQADGAESARMRFMQQWAGNFPALDILQHGALFRLFCGPFSNRDEATAAVRTIQENSDVRPLIVQR